MISLVTVAALSIFGLALLMTGLSGTRSLNHHNDDYRLSSAVESVAIMAADNLWAGYWGANLTAFPGESGSIQNFQAYLDSIGIVDNGLGAPPTAAEGQNILGAIGVAGSAIGNPEFNNVNIDAVQVFRRDQVDSTQLYLTVSASTNRGQGIVNPVLNRAVQQVYTVEPTAFEGFDYGILANNVNCIFCHTQVDSTDRFYDATPGPLAEYDRVKVGTLESLMLRHDMDGKNWVTNDYDSDSVVGGSIYVRGDATDHAGVPIASGDWASLSMGSVDFNATGKIVPDAFGDVTISSLSPAGSPPVPMENLYLNYPSAYEDMVDGGLPKSFPPPIPDDGGVDPSTGIPSGAGAGNKMVDDEEFFASTASSEGSLTSGFISVTDSATPITTVPDYQAALTTVDLDGIQNTANGNVILRGTAGNPIHIDGDVAIDGDLIITGLITGEGTITVRGNVYIPTDIEYLDGVDVDGNRTFGYAPEGQLYNGQVNKLGISAGGNIMIGDYLRPMFAPAASTNIVSGTDVPQGASVAHWSFSLAEITLFNRTEWMKTQQLLPGPGEDNTDPTTWTVGNPHYVAPDALGNPYTPRYYSYGDGDKIPMYNKGGLYYDSTADTWLGDFEVPITWDPALLSYLPSAGAVVSQVSPSDTWITEDMYKVSLDYFMQTRPVGKPLQIDALLYTNNAIFGIVNRNTTMVGQLRVNGALVCADLGVLAPGLKYTAGLGTGLNVPGSEYLIGLRLNYDKRVKDLLKVTNPNQVEIKRTLWNPTSNVL